MNGQILIVNFIQAGRNFLDMQNLALAK